MKCYMTGRACNYYKADEQNRNIFIISPFGFPYDSLYKNNSEVYNCLKKELNLSPQRSDQAMRLGSIMCQGICKEIIERQYIFADLSQPNPNVYYELGLAWALKRKIIVCASNRTSNAYLKLFKKEFEEQQAFIEFDSVNQLVSGLKRIKAVDKYLENRIQGADEEEKKKILILESNVNPISRFYEQVLSKEQENFEFKELLKDLNDSERRSFVSENWKTWIIETKIVSETSSFEGLIKDIKSSHVCIVDVTADNVSGGRIINPYMYFSLGLAHGLEREVIPITNTLYSNGTPFDVKGMWHIFFSNEDELKNGFCNIIPRISVDYHRELESRPYRQIWDGFLLDKRELTIIYCGRPVISSGKGDKRGPRTNVDSWDSRTVSEASFYLAQKYQTTTIRPASPKTKIPGLNPRVIKQIEDDLKGENYQNCLIIGSPDVSDYAEIMLSKIYGINPFNTNKLERKRERFVFYKNNIQANIHSSFYRKDKINKVEFSHIVIECEETKTHGVTYGVLTIANNPFVEDGKVMVLSGFTGLATCGLMQLLIESEMENTASTSASDIALDRILRDFDPNHKTPFSALVKFTYGCQSKEFGQQEGDDRVLTMIEVLDTHAGK